MDKNTNRPVSIFIPTLGGGGAERVMVMLANSFASKGHSTHLVLLKASGPYLSEVDARVKIFDLNKTRMLFALRALVLYLINERPKCLLSAMNYANIIALAAVRLSNKKIWAVISERSSPSGYRNFKFQNIILPLMKLMYPMANRIICVSEGVAKELQELVGVPYNKIDVIPNPLDIKSISLAMDDVITHPWILDPAKKVILAVGRLSDEKNYETLIRAMVNIREHNDAVLIILGEGYRRPALEELVQKLNLEEHIEMPGFDANPFPLMNKCDAYVLCSRTEGFPNSLVQAMACGAPVISTDCHHGPREILEGGKYGTLVPVGSPEMLANAIVQAFSCGAHKHARKKAEEYSVDKIVNKYLGVLGVPV